MSRILLELPWMDTLILVTFKRLVLQFVTWHDVLESLICMFLINIWNVRPYHTCCCRQLSICHELNLFSLFLFLLSVVRKCNNKSLSSSAFSTSHFSFHYYSFCGNLPSYACAFQSCNYYHVCIWYDHFFLFYCHLFVFFCSLNIYNNEVCDHTYNTYGTFVCTVYCRLIGPFLFLFFLHFYF